MDILIWVLVGLAAGALARLFVLGREPMGWVGTLAIGLIGSTTGGFIGATFTSAAPREFEPAGLIGSIVGAVVVLFVYRALTRRSA